MFMIMEVLSFSGLTALYKKPIILLIQYLPLNCWIVELEVSDSNI